MKYYHWKGGKTYEYLVACNSREMRQLMEQFPIDPLYVQQKQAALNIGGEEMFFYFVSVQRKRIALMPFLAIAFGGQYNGDAPVGGEVQSMQINLEEYELEAFRFQ